MGLHVHITTCNSLTIREVGPKCGFTTRKCLEEYINPGITWAPQGAGEESLREGQGIICRLKADTGIANYPKDSKNRHAIPEKID